MITITNKNTTMKAQDGLFVSNAEARRQARLLRKGLDFSRKHLSGITPFNISGDSMFGPADQYSSTNLPEFEVTGTSGLIDYPQAIPQVTPNPNLINERAIYPASRRVRDYNRARTSFAGRGYGGGDNVEIPTGDFTPDEDLFKRYRRDLAISTGVGTAFEVTNIIGAYMDEARNRDQPYPATIERIKFSPSSPRYVSAEPEYADIDRGFVSGITMARQLGRADLIPGMLANREDARRKISTEVGRQNLASTTEISRLNLQGLMAAQRLNIGVDELNIRNRMEHERFMAGVTASNRAMGYESMAGIVNMGSRYVENRLSADITEKVYNQLIASGDTEALNAFYANMWK